MPTIKDKKYAFHNCNGSIIKRLKLLDEKFKNRNFFFLTLTYPSTRPAILVRHVFDTQRSPCFSLLFCPMLDECQIQIKAP
jgi:hypothetical protein